MGEIALVTTLAIFAVSLAEVGRRAVLGRRMEHAMSRLRTAEFQQIAWPEPGLRVEPEGTSARLV
jgi:hypothetical protein